VGYVLFERLKKARRPDVPCYYLVVHAADHSHEDPHGTDLADHRAAHAYVHRIVRELKEGGYHPLAATMPVRDEAGNTLHSGTF
jgi:hypothetical protein